MIEKYLKEIIAHFNLGENLNVISPVYGGLLHKMWKIQTSNGFYAIKEISSRIDFLNPDVVLNYEMSEKIAFALKSKGIPAVCAIKKKDKYIFSINKSNFLIYPWFEGKTLSAESVTLEHSSKISKIISNIHKINLNIPGLSNPKYDIILKDYFSELINKYLYLSLLHSKMLKKTFILMLECIERYNSSIDQLSNNCVISHGDLDRKNVMWNEKGEPYLIDWESARKINPQYELLNLALDWSGIDNNFNEENFIKMINVYEIEYCKMNKSEFDFSLNGVLGNWINWMIYNLDRATNPKSEDEIKMSEEQIFLVISILQRLNSVQDDLRKIFM